MIKKLHKTTALVSLSAMTFGLTAFPALAQLEDTLASERARTVVDRATLQQARGATPAQAMGSLMRERGASSETINSISASSDYVDAAGQRFVRFEQRLQGLRVHGAYGKAAFNASGNMIHAIERFAPAQRNIPAPGIGISDALRAALDNNFADSVDLPASLSDDGTFGRFAKTDFFHEAPTTERVIISGRGGKLEQGYLVTAWREAGNVLFHTLVDGQGRVVWRELRTAEDSYRIFADHPGTTSQSLVAGPGAGNAQSPIGWLSGSQFSNLISGNNVSAYLDRDNNNAPDAAGSAIGDGNFLAVADLNSAPTTTQNQAVAVQNLFYFNNIIHDMLYDYGFVEAEGNFQNDNFGNGGAGGDAVLAEAQDGGSTNNANFATPADGSSGRMQMYLWTQTSPQRDGDLDSDIILHEYGHGLTWRMIGSMSGPISGAIGEGMSDVLAIVYHDNDVVGEYSFANPVGIRSAPYTNYPRTLGNFGGSSVHFDGEIYAATIWDLKGRYGNDDLLMRDLIGGMRFTPAGPTYPDMRDGIVAQVNARGGDTCPVWESFAQFGIGDGARMSVKGGGPFGGGKVSVTESFALPAECDSTSPPPPPPPPPPPSGDVTLTGLSGTTETQGRNRWRARVSPSADTEGAVVAIDWSSGAQSECTIANGTCEVTVTLRNNVSSVTATVTSINGATVVAADGVSTSVTLNRP